MFQQNEKYLSKTKRNYNFSYLKAFFTFQFELKDKNESPCLWKCVFLCVDDTHNTHSLIVNSKCRSNNKILDTSACFDAISRLPLENFQRKCQYLHKAEK